MAHLRHVSPDETRVSSANLAATGTCKGVQKKSGWVCLCIPLLLAIRESSLAHGNTQRHLYRFHA